MPAARGSAAAQGRANTPSTEPPARTAALPRAPSGDPLLAAKLALPAVAPGFVRRQRLLDRLTEATAGPLTLVTGPAGAGKTTLAASWARLGAVPGPVLWMTVDDVDSPGVFWAYVLEAFRRGLLLPSGDIDVPVHSDAVDHSLLVRFAAALERLPEPVVLVLDGLEKLPGREVAAGLAFVLDHAGPRLRLVLISRVDPLLPLHRYRTEGRLHEIRGGELAFTPPEAAALLRGHGLAPGRETVGALTERTEGWAAGLRLCALAIERSGDADGFTRSFSASEHAVADYLLTEVLEAQPAATRELLTRTSVLGRVHPDLANALTGRADAERILARLIHDNCFVEPIADTPWCRVHPLFAEVLHAHLRGQRPGLEPRLHRRAARWFADSGHLTESLVHGAAAGDWTYTAGEAVRHLMIGRLLTGPEATGLAGLFSGMPADVQGAEAALVAGASLLSRYDIAGCRAQLDRADGKLHREGARPSTEARLGHALLRLLSASYGDGGGTGEETARQVEELMAQLPRFRLKEHPEIEALRRHGLGCALLGSGRLHDARATFEDAVRACTGEATDLVRHASLGRLSLAEGIDGALCAAADHALRSLAVADEHGVDQGRRSGAGHLGLATVASERGELLAAAHHLDLAEACSDTHDDPVLSTERAVLRSRVAAARGSGEAARRILDACGPDRPSWPAERLAVARSAAALERGDAAAALAVLHAAGPGGLSWTVALARAHLAAGRTEQARRLVAPADGSPGLIRSDRLRVELVRARTALLDGDRAAALALLAQALDTAGPEELRRPFAEAGPWLWHLLRTRDDRHGRDDRPVAPGWLTARPPDRPAGAILVEPLSAREQEVLGYVARMMSNEEIAAELHLSVNTVKTHLRSVYRKLCASRRREAVERGRELHLL